MAQYISQMRRGVKDDSIGRDDWAEYEKQPNHMMPLEGELVLEYDNGIPENAKAALRELFAQESLIVPKKGKGRIEIEFYNKNDFEILVEALKKIKTE